MNTIQPIQHLGKLGREDGDGWNTADARKERKRIQNRLNQRAHRRRNPTRVLKSTTGRRPYRVERWRVDETSSLASDETTSSTINSQASLSVKALTLPAQPGDDLALLPGALDHMQAISHTSSSFHINFPLSSDHLLHLIHHNVLRALLSNKSFLNTTTILTAGSSPNRILPSGRYLCDGLTVVRSVDPSLPHSLVPTELQMHLPHSSWINMLPFPQMRDNLIRWEDSFDHEILCRDLFGDVVNANQPILPDKFMGLASSEAVIIESDVDDEITTDRKGLIVWGEPYEPESWEVTPGFVKKWAWLLLGCEDLIETSNRWRAVRNESPMQLQDLLMARDQFLFLGKSLQIPEKV